MLKMIDQGKNDEKILAVGTNNPVLQDVREYSELYPHLVREIEHFFSIYKELEAKSTRIVGWSDAQQARRTVSESQERFARGNR
jgi:inorganic pyrophosphatase